MSQKLINNRPNNLNSKSNNNLQQLNQNPRFQNHQHNTKIQYNNKQTDNWFMNKQDQFYQNSPSQKNNSFQQLINQMQNQKFNCFCGKQFYSKKALKNHIYYRHPDKADQYLKSKKPKQEIMKSQMFLCRCGASYRYFKDLKVHISCKHPGSILPLSNMVYPKPQDPHYPNEQIQKCRFKCGCGNRYTCSSALNLHIRRKHNAKAPRGTIGGYGDLQKFKFDCRRTKHYENMMEARQLKKLQQQGGNIEDVQQGECILGELNQLNQYEEKKFIKAQQMKLNSIIMIQKIKKMQQSFFSNLNNGQSN